MVRVVPAIVAHQGELAFRGVGAAHVLREDGVALTGVELAVGTGPPGELVGDALDKDRVLSGRGWAPEHGIQQGAVTHRGFAAGFYDDLVRLLVHVRPRSLAAVYLADFGGTTECS